METGFGGKRKRMGGGRECAGKFRSVVQSISFNSERWGFISTTADSESWKFGGGGEGLLRPPKRGSWKHSSDGGEKR